MRFPKHSLNAQFDEVLEEILEVKDNWYFSKNNFESSFSLSIISINSSWNSKIRDRFVICLSWGFQNCHWFLKLMKNLLIYSRLKAIEPLVLQSKGSTSNCIKSYAFSEYVYINSNFFRLSVCLCIKVTHGKAVLTLSLTQNCANM